MHTRRLRWLAAFALVVATTLVSSHEVSAGGDHPHGGKACRIWNPASKQGGDDLQAAVDAATSGDTLRIRGVCDGDVTIDKDLQLVGPAVLDGETCDGGYCSRGIVLWVYSGKVTLKNLKITNGSSTFTGGGIQNAGTLVLSGWTTVADNLAEDGAGGINNEGTLIMTDWSSVRNNSILGGIGGGIINAGTLIMKDHALVTGNPAQEGGGIYNHSIATITMKGRSSVTGNTADVGGGILNNGGVVEFSPAWHGTVCGNTPDDWPGCGL